MQAKRPFSTIHQHVIQLSSDITEDHKNRYFQKPNIYCQNALKALNKCLSSAVYSDKDLFIETYKIFVDLKNSYLTPSAKKNSDTLRLFADCLFNLREIFVADYNRLTNMIYRGQTDLDKHDIQEGWADIVPCEIILVNHENLSFIEKRLELELDRKLQDILCVELINHLVDYNLAVYDKLNLFTPLKSETIADIFNKLCTSANPDLAAVKNIMKNHTTYRHIKDKINLNKIFNVGLYESAYRKELVYLDNAVIRFLVTELKYHPELTKILFKHFEYSTITYPSEKSKTNHMDFLEFLCSNFSKQNLLHHDFFRLPNYAEASTNLLNTLAKSQARKNFNQHFLFFGAGGVVDSKSVPADLKKVMAQSSVEVTLNS